MLKYLLCTKKFLRLPLQRNFTIRIPNLNRNLNNIRTPFHEISSFRSRFHVDYTSAFAREIGKSRRSVFGVAREIIEV